MHGLTASILGVSNVFQNKTFPIHERVFVSPPPYYIDYFERSYPNAPLNRDSGPFSLKFAHVTQRTKADGQQWNILPGVI